MEGEHRSHLVARLRAATTVDTKCSKLLGNKGMCRKLAFYQLNYSRSFNHFKYRIIGFTATGSFSSLGIQVLLFASERHYFSMAYFVKSWLIDLKTDSKLEAAPRRKYFDDANASANFPSLPLAASRTW